MYNEIHKQDIKFGKRKEEEYLSHLRILFDDESIIKNPEYNSLFDYVGNGKMIELKSRKCLSNSYMTTIVSARKLENLNSDLDYYFVFDYLDDSLFCKYNEQDFIQFEYKQISRKDRGKIETDLYICIPINYLKPFTTFDYFD